MALLKNLTSMQVSRLCIINTNRMNTLKSVKVMLPIYNGCRLQSQSIERLKPQVVTRMRRFQETNRRIQIKDKVPPDFELVYKAPMSMLIKVATYCTALAVVTIASASIYVFIFGDNLDWDIAFRHSDFIAAESVDDIWIFAVAFALASLVLRFIASRYVLRIYKNGKDYVAITQGLLTSTRRKKFAIGQASRADNGTFYLKDRRHFVLEDYFVTFREVAIMLDKHDYIVRQEM